MARTFVDAVGVMASWINSRTGALTGPGNPLWLGAHLKRLGGGEPATYAFLEEQLSTVTPDSPENPDMAATLTAQVYGGSREAATIAAVALAEEWSTQLEGREVLVADKGAIMYAADNIQGPTWLPDGVTPRLLVNVSVRMRPA